MSGQPWVVMKFGGTSVSSQQCWQVIAQQAKQAREEGAKVMIVVSAMAGVTNQLNTIAATEDITERQALFNRIKQQHKELLVRHGLEPSTGLQQELKVCEQRVLSVDGSPQAIAALVISGERLSSMMGVALLESHGVQAQWQDATRLLDALPVSDQATDWLACAADFTPDKALSGQLDDGVHITQGFVAGDEQGQVRLLGRGGSDISAACLAARLSAQHLEIWTDVPGMFSADPRVVPSARQLQQISYSEAKELASMGAKVLHPRCIRPIQTHGIPLWIKDTNRPEVLGTLVEERSAVTEAQVKGVVSRRNVTLISMETSKMWHQAGFLADAFSLFKQHGFSVDLIATAEANVTVTLDPDSDESGVNAFSTLLQDLSEICQVEVRRQCVSISLVGNAIRSIIGSLASALDVFRERNVYMLTQSANDLNITLVVDAEYADRLVQQLHRKLVESVADQHQAFGICWNELDRNLENKQKLHWSNNYQQDLLEQMQGRNSAYIYHLDTVRQAARRLQGMSAVDRVLYAVKANNHPEVLGTLADQGVGFECVSLEEVEHLMLAVPELAYQDILFTPNFAPKAEYQKAFELGVQVTVDNIYPLREWPEVFTGQSIFLRLDLDNAQGHHQKVMTAGVHSKFGIPVANLPEVADMLESIGAKVTGLHSHSGSGISSAEMWAGQLRLLLSHLQHFPDVNVIDLGGGLAVPEFTSDQPLDMDKINQHILAVKEDTGTQVDIWVEPGRYLVAESGVLLTKATQIKGKGRQQYLGVATGMNSLIRPALYGAYHPIFNLSRMNEPATESYNVVGPICETGDVLGNSRYLPESKEGDVLLIANCGAYGAVMSSRYNLRAPAEEIVI